MVERREGGGLSGLLLELGRRRERAHGGRGETVGRLRVVRRVTLRLEPVVGEMVVVVRRVIVVLVLIVLAAAARVRLVVKS